MSVTKKSVTVEHTEERLVVQCDGPGCSSEGVKDESGFDASDSWFRLTRGGYGNNPMCEIVGDACSEHCLLGIIQKVEVTQ